MTLQRNVHIPKLKGIMYVKVYGTLVIGDIPKLVLVIMHTPTAYKNKPIIQPIILFEFNSLIINSSFHINFK